MSSTNVQFAVATHIVTVLGYHHGTPITSATLAESVRAEPTFVRRTLSKLSKAGLVSSTRGKNGASLLARRPEDISLLDVYRASEAGPTFAVHRYPVEKTCPISRNIKSSLGDVLNVAQGAFEKSLKSQTVADVIKNLRRSV